MLAFRGKVFHLFATHSAVMLFSGFRGMSSSLVPAWTLSWLAVPTIFPVTLREEKQVKFKALRLWFLCWIKVLSKCMLDPSILSTNLVLICESKLLKFKDFLGFFALYNCRFEHLWILDFWSIKTNSKISHRCRKTVQNT